MRSSLTEEKKGSVSSSFCLLALGSIATVVYWRDDRHEKVSKQCGSGIFYGECDCGKSDVFVALFHVSGGLRCR